jgi:chromosome segregation ATPase
MKKISKGDVSKLEEIVADLTSKKTDVETAIEKANEAIVEANAAIEEYNGHLEEAEALRDSVVGAIEEYVGDKSEKWQEGDAAASYEDWKGEWEGIDFSEVDPIEELTAPDMDHSSELEGLPQEVSL